MARQQSSRSITVAVLTALLALGLSVTPGFAADTTAPFSGQAVNGGTVTHDVQGGKHVLTVSADFEAPGSPDPTGRSWTARGTCTCWTA
jgi:hypothetical protein